MATAARSQENKELSIADASNMKIAIAVSQWNKNITENLYNGAHDTLVKYGVLENHILKISIPGSFELPLAAQFILEEKEEIDAVICLGSVIQGETKHFDYVCEAVSQGIKDVSLKYNKPVIFGVLTDNFLQQSIDRSGGKLGNKGDEAAMAALEMVALKQQLKK